VNSHVSGQHSMPALRRAAAAATRSWPWAVSRQPGRRPGAPSNPPCQLQIVSAGWLPV